MFESWGRQPHAPPRAVRPLVWCDTGLGEERPLLAVGLRRSYGDVCQNGGGVVLETARLDRLLSFDGATGVLRCEAGVSLGQLLAFSVPRGWALPVLPGTRHVTVGGAIANDIHGKNHQRAGSFGCHVRRLALRRSGGELRECVPGEPLFAATVAGLGLTGLLLWAELQLRPVPGPALRVETVPFADLDGFFAAEEAAAGAEYSVAWIDGLARGKRLGRGLLYRGDHVPGAAPAPRAGPPVPFDAPGFVLSRPAVAVFNAGYRFAGRLRRGTRVVHFEPFFFPLDSVRGWNRLYGARGFFQFQCVVPGREAVVRLLERVADHGAASFLSVLKTFGAVRSPGLLSFPRPGVTLALDFANRGAGTQALLGELEELALEAGGALYPAKDALMRPATFAASFPRLGEFLPHVDPGFSSSFWRRVRPEGAR